jgi:cyclophilin family peptidyl-prolyl cis-trans isomerase
MARRQKRRRRVRSSVIVVVVAVLVVGSVYLITKHHTPPKSTTTSTTVTAKTRQARLEAVWTKAGCPATIPTRVNTQKYSSAPANTLSATATYTATVKTDVGSFVITLNQKEAPIAVNSFVSLASKNYFNCNLFHRVIQGFVDQTGDPTGPGGGGPGYQFTEAGPPVATPQYPLGSVAMANSSSGTTDPSTNGSQWFVVTGSSGESLPPDYVLFGQVTSGMNVLQEIAKDGASSSSGSTGTPKVFHRILTVTIKES